MRTKTPRYLTAATLALVSVGCASRKPLLTPNAPVAITRVVLFQNGLGYFERKGRVEADSIDLETRRDQLDDVLKTLSVIDTSGGRVASVRVLSSGRSPETVTLRVGLAGDSTHDLTVSYVAASSGWRPSYRIIDVGNGRVRVQGFALVDNHAGEAWQNAEVALSTELPLSFEYTLREPRVAHRPRLGPDGRLVTEQAAPEAPRPADGNMVQAAYAYANSTTHIEHNTRAGGMVGRDLNVAGLPRPPALVPTGGGPVDPLAIAESREGERGFTIESASRVTLQANETGMVPFMDEQTSGESVLLFKPSTAGGASATRPYRAMMFHNPMRAPWLAGPVAVYARRGYAGDGLTAIVPASADAFVAYAMDSAVTVTSTSERRDDEVHAAGIVAGDVLVDVRNVMRTRFTADSPSAWSEKPYFFVSAIQGYDARELPAATVVSPAGYFVPGPARVRHADLAFDLVRRERQRVNVATDPMHAYADEAVKFLAASGDFATEARRLREIRETFTRLGEQVAEWNRDVGVQRDLMEERRTSLITLRLTPANADVRRTVADGLQQAAARVEDLTRRIAAANLEESNLRAEWYARLRSIRTGAQE